MGHLTWYSHIKTKLFDNSSVQFWSFYEASELVYTIILSELIIGVNCRMEQITTFHSLFLQIVETFSEFLSSGGHDSRYVTARCPSNYLNIMNMDIKLTTYLIPKDARNFILHLVGDSCTCTFCLEVSRLITLNLVSSAPPTHIIPVDFSVSCGKHMVTRLHAAQVHRLIIVISVITTTNIRQEELRRRLHVLLVAALRWHLFFSYILTNLFITLPNLCSSFPQIF